MGDTESNYPGKLVDVPSCRDPKTTGLTFKIQYASAVLPFYVAGPKIPKQSPTSALATGALLRCSRDMQF